MSPLLSILMPAYDESATLMAAVERVLSVDYPCTFEPSSLTTGVRTARGTSYGEIPSLVQVVIDDNGIEVVYGTRTFGSHNAYSFWYVMGNKAVTLAANVLFDSYISDLETCFKLLPVALYRELDVRSAGFGMEAEVTAKLLRRGGPRARSSPGATALKPCGS